MNALDQAKARVTEKIKADALAILETANANLVIRRDEAVALMVDILSMSLPFSGLTPEDVRTKAEERVAADYAPLFEMIENRRKEIEEWA